MLRNSTIGEKNEKRIMKTITACILTVMMIGTSSSAVSMFGVYIVSGTTNSIQSNFQSETKVTKGTGWGLRTGKIVKQSYVRMREGKYDSGRRYSAIVTGRKQNV